jgi:adenosylcobyric acid synthase
MGLAELINAKVLLVGNIDPGGVFAQLYGTVGLLSEAERSRITGFIINKFRGDVNLLKPGLAELTSLTDIPVLGVVPFADVRIEEEDSLSAELTRRDHKKLIDIAVIRLPFISNYTDFEPFDRSDHLGVRYVEEAVGLGRPDLIVIPGSKNTIEDLRWLKSKGLFKAILAAGDNGSDILGICGGYQMLGKRLWEPESGESEEGFSYFPLSTEFRPGKLTRQVRGRLTAGPFKGVSVSGYEIHSGVTTLCGDGESRGGEALSELETNEGERFADGFIKGNVCGTYLHGIFESGELLRRLSVFYLNRRGLPSETVKTAGDYNVHRQEQYDILAELVRESVDIKKIYEAMG